MNCARCNAPRQPGALACPYCGVSYDPVAGQPLAMVPVAPMMAYPAGPLSSRGEQTLLSEQGVIVSTTRFVVGSAMYPINGITSVSAFVIPPKRGLAILLIVVGLFTCIPAIIGIVMLLTMKARHVVRVATAGGQVDALASTDGALIQRVVSALNNAVAMRG